MDKDIRCSICGRESTHIYKIEDLKRIVPLCASPQCERLVELRAFEDRQQEDIIFEMLWDEEREIVFEE
jgi:hypothetical protein